ncbi:hypothetical protein Pcinc_024167 [Petrolisthes cinctipes]|uniref:Uncharacterized protein n=1 Tax=Petrolisthes cinctipes TaxID=88211 RepID=A0AAE1KET0_PETCI|nr:hypothetical protein Pcinc_024167 [Petrolisthes cinctipes]
MRDSWRLKEIALVVEFVVTVSPFFPTTATSQHSLQVGRHMNDPPKPRGDCTTQEGTPESPEETVLPRKKHPVTSADPFMHYRTDYQKLMVVMHR